MSFPDPNELIPNEDTHCTKCGLEIRADAGKVRYMRRLPVGRVRRGAFHPDCAPPHIDAWLADLERQDGSGS